MLNRYQKMLNFSHVFVIAEAGSNWKAGSYSEDLARAKKLIRVAAECGADAIKFQTFRADTIYVSNAGNSDYLEKSGIKKNINKIFEKSEMPYEMLAELSKYCKKMKIEFMSSAFSVDDARAINKYVRIHKVASYEINYIRLLEYLAGTKKPIILSTGASNYEEIDFAINLLKKHHVKDYSLLQCTAKYPAPLEKLNLGAIPEMEKRYDVQIGLSDHSLDPVIGPLIAVGLGAKIIEKHFTLDRNLSGPDHKFALEPHELKRMVQSIKMAEMTIGDGKKRVLDVEKELRDFAVRRIQASKDIKKGERFVEGYNVSTLRPGKRLRGAEARFLSKIIGKKSKRSIKIGDGIRLQDCI
jgi:N,N'-diacetyllegionaminate synthase